MDARGSNMRTTEKVLWFLVGACVGAGIALLYAPQSGKDTRKFIRRRAEDAKDSLVEAGEQIKDTLVEKGEGILEAGKEVYRKGMNVATGAAGVFNRARA
jgi:gas vesicle protein